MSKAGSGMATHPDSAQGESAAVCRVCGTGVGVLKGEEVWPFGSVLYRLAECLSCGCAFTVPLPTDRVLRDVYAKMFDYRWYRDHLRAKMRDAAARYAEYRPLLGASVLDFGGGLGYFSAICRARGHVSVTLDAYAPHGGLAPGSQFDTVVALHVLEHANDIDGLILQMRAFLKPGGNLIIAVPNYRSAGYRERGMRWVWAQPPLIHIYHFTAEGLAALLRRRGFRRLEISYHERWDANRPCDLERAEEFAAWDGMWARRPHNRFTLYRRFVALRNARRRFRGLASAVRASDTADTSLSELQITAQRDAH